MVSERGEGMSKSMLAQLWHRGRSSAIAYAGIATVIRMGANVLLLPVVLQKLSTGDLALWWVFLALGAFANLADFGFGAAIIRVYSYLWAGADDFETEGLRAASQSSQPNLAKLRELNATAQMLYVRLALAATFILALVGTFFVLGPAQSSNHPMQVWLAWLLYLVSIGFSLGTMHWSFACQGIDRMRELHSAYMWSSLTYLASAVALLFSGLGIFALVIATLLRAVVGQQLCWRTYRRAVPADSVNGPPKPNYEMLRKLWPNAWKFGVLAIGAYLVANSSVLISSVLLGEEVTASFGLTFQIGALLVNFSGLWLTVKWSQITILRTQGKLVEMSTLFARRLAFSMITYALMAILLAMLGNWLLEWKGVNTRLLAFPFLAVYLFHLGQQMFFSQFASFTFTENVVPFFKLSLFTGIGLIALSFALTPWLGLWGLVLAPLLATMACSSWYPVWRGFRGQPLTVRQFVRAAIQGGS